MMLKRQAKKRRSKAQIDAERQEAKMKEVEIQQQLSQADQLNQQMAEMQ